MTEQERIDRLAEWMGWHRGIEGCLTSSWFGATNWQVPCSWNPFTSLDDAHLLLEELGRRGRLSEVIDKFYSVNVYWKLALEAGLLATARRITEDVEAVVFPEAAQAAKEESMMTIPKRNKGGGAEASINNRWYWCDSYSYRKALEDEIERLQAIVDKLPKTADGVPVVPGMAVFYSCKDFGPIRLTVADYVDWTEYGPLCFGTHGGVCHGQYADTCYSTREAARPPRQREENNDGN